MKGQGTEHCLFQALIAPRTWMPGSMLANWTQLALFSQTLSYLHLAGPYLQCIPANCGVSSLDRLLAFRTPAIS